MTFKLPLNLDIKEIKKHLQYNPDTGILTWVVPLNPRCKIGSVAGTLDSSGYFKLGFKGTRYLNHRIIFFYMTGQDPETIDHKNGNPKDNRWSNLRAVTRSQNRANCLPSKCNKTGFKGVQRAGKRFKAFLTSKRKVYYLGTYDTPEEASNAYKIKFLEVYKEFKTRT